MTDNTINQNLPYGSRSLSGSGYSSPFVSTRIVAIFCSVIGRSLPSVFTAAILSTTSIPFEHLAERRVLAVQELAVFVHDEELATWRSSATARAHRQNAALMAQVVLHAVELELAPDAVAGAAHTSSLRAAALDHEAGDDAVKNQAVVEALICKG